ncbi:MAG: molybdopterin-dependent oxidoreductase [Chloroflexota bacterium]
MRYSWANTLLFILLIWQFVSGLWGLMTGVADRYWVLWWHGLGGYAVGLILFWKGAVILDTLKRRRFTWNTAVFLFLALLLLTILGTGFIWTTNGPIYLAGFSLINIHGHLSILLMPLLGWHVVARRFIFRVPQARDRRAAMRFAGFSLVALLLGRLAERTKAATELPGAKRRFTGSYERGSFSGQFPQVSWLFDFPNPQRVDDWQLVLTGKVKTPLTFSYEAFTQLPTETITTTLDCTGGWYTTQVWCGVKLGDLLDLADVDAEAQSVTVEAVSGYKRRFPLSEARDYLLALAVADEPLSHGHGYPVRLVAPGRRGFEWVKWVVRIRVNGTSHIWQMPLPLQ